MPKTPPRHPLPRPASKLLLAPEERLRIARALVGATPAQLATHVGAAPLAEGGLAEAAVANRPTRSLDDLAAAFRAVIAWHADAISAAPEAAGRRLVAPGAAAGLDGLVRQYLVLRAERDTREAQGVRTALARLPAPAPAPPAATAPGTGPARRRAVLVDDSSDVLVTVGAFLEAFGFDVTTTSDSDSALGLLAGGIGIDLLVTDHAMPGMTGRDLAAEAGRQRPGLRTLIITGYPDLEELGTLPPHATLLPKPFRRAELAARIWAMFEPQGTPMAGALPAAVD